jgi:NAD+ diphosphatase
VLDGRLCYAVDVLDEDDVDLDLFRDLRLLWGTLDEVTWTIAGRGAQLVDWQRTHRFCGRCATATEAARGERARRCPSCGLLAFPRLAPAVITLVERDDGRILLARNRNFGAPMFSLLAGFVEPGETLEQAVVRETLEEVGVAVDGVRYWGSQPWPFPHSLMVGFRARYAGGELALQEDEIAEAGWFAPDDLPMIPPTMSIAGRMIEAWVAGHR